MIEFFENIGKFFQRLPEDKEYFIFTISAWSIAIVALILWFVWIGIAKHRKAAIKKLDHLLNDYLLNEKSDTNVKALYTKISELEKNLNESEIKVTNLDALVKTYESNLDVCNPTKIDELNKQITDLQCQVKKYTDENLALRLEMADQIQLERYKEENAKLEKKAKSLKTTKDTKSSKKPKTYLEELRLKKRSELFALAKEYGLTDYAKMTNEDLCKKISRAYLKKKREEENKSNE